MNRYFSVSLIIILLTIPFSFVHAADRPNKFEKPEEVVAWLYRDFGWESFIGHYFKDDGLIDQPLSIYLRYFTHELADLIVKDRKYEVRTKELGHIDFVLIFGSQDPVGISNIRINRKPGTNIVAVVYDQNSEKDVMGLDFETVKTASGWRISDIHYKSKQSHAFPNSGIDFSLLKLLSVQY